MSPFEKMIEDNKPLLYCHRCRPDLLLPVPCGLPGVLDVNVIDDRVELMMHGILDPAGAIVGGVQYLKPGEWVEGFAILVREPNAPTPVTFRLRCPICRQPDTMLRYFRPGNFQLSPPSVPAS